MRVLITGAEGMLATALIKLLKDEHEVTGVGKKNLNITDESGIESALSSMRPEVVINSAAFTKVDECEEKKELACAVNAEGPRILAAACRDRGIKLIHISTDYVFDGKKREPYSEDDRVNPINEYGRTKLKGEEYIKEILDDHLIVRTQWLYGEGGHNFVKTILRLSKEKDELNIVNDRTGSPTYTYDLSHAIKALMETGCRGTYHAANSGSCTWYGFALEILKSAGITMKVVPIKTDASARPAVRPANSILNCGKLERDVAFTFRPWQDALREYVSKLD